MAGAPSHHGDSRPAPKASHAISAATSARPRRAREILSSSRAASATPSWCRDSRRSYSSRGVAAVNRRPYTVVTASRAAGAPITWP